MRYVRFYLAALLLLAAGCDSLKTTAPVLPVEDFFKNPEKAAFHLSPTGEYISYVAPYQSRLNIFVQKSTDTTATRITDVTESDIDKYFWVNKNRLIYIQDDKGNEKYRLIAVNYDGSSMLDITPKQDVSIKIISLLENDDDHILAAFNIENERLFDVYKLNVYTGEIELYQKNPGTVIGWQSDKNGNLRIAITSDGVNTGLLYRSKESEKFSLIQISSSGDDFYPVGFAPDDKHLYIASNKGRDKTAIIEFDPIAKTETSVLYENSAADVYHVITSPKTNDIVGVEYFTSHKNYKFFSSFYEKLFEELKLKLPGYELEISDISLDETTALVKAYSDKSMGKYYLYEASSGDMKFLAELTPWLNESNMASMKSISYVSRDGLKITGYLTIPKGRKAVNLPVVVKPHGGPWARDFWGFDEEAQFLANRGYAVLEVNYRGSTGFGKAFHQAGFREWGDKMQNDITDGVRWLIDQKIADSTRIGIYGYSFGGYAALAGLAFTPDLYKCGVSYAGLANLFSYLDGIPPQWESYREMMYHMVGNPKTDSLQLYNASPFFHHAKFKAPLFIAMGANDPRVPQKDIEILAAKVKKRGIYVEYMVKGDEGHGYRKEENRLEFYSKMEKFLARYLNGKVYKKD